MKLTTADKETLLSALGIIHKIVNDSTPVASPIAAVEPSAPVKKWPSLRSSAAASPPSAPRSGAAAPTREKRLRPRKTEVEEEEISSSIEWEEAVPIDDDSLGEYSSSYSEEHRTNLNPSTSKPQRRKRVARFDIGEEDDDDIGEDITGGSSDPSTLEMMHAMRKLQGRGGMEAFIRTIGGARIWQHIRDVIRVQSTTDCFESFRKLIIDAKLPEKEELKSSLYSFCYLCKLKRQCKYAVNGYTVGGTCVGLYDAIRDLLTYLQTADPETVDMKRVGKMQVRIQANKNK